MPDYLVVHFYSARAASISEVKPIISEEIPASGTAERLIAFIEEADSAAGIIALVLPQDSLCHPNATLGGAVPFHGNARWLARRRWR